MSFKLSLASALTLLGVAMPLPEFVAGLLMATGGYFAGRSIWKEAGNYSLWTGFAIAMGSALLIALMPGLIPIDAPTQAKMMLAGFVFVPVMGWVEKNTGAKPK